MKTPILLILSTGLLSAQSEPAECAFFGPQHDRIASAGRNALPDFRRGALTTQVVSSLPNFVPGGSRTNSQFQIDQLPLIDRHIFGTLAEKGVTPADRSSDPEFLRRVSLDLTGRIPDAARLNTFLADTRSNKRELLIDELLAKPEWTDKWTMFFGDLYRNNQRNTQINRYPSGVVAFNDWIRTSLQSGKPYNQMASEAIVASGTDSYSQGELNYLAGAYVTGGPMQDVYDAQAADIAKVFLGMSHLNCILCHNGRGHLDTLSVWGKSATRQQAWGMASFLSRTLSVRRPINTDSFNPYKWTIEDSTAIRFDYQLNTTTGNRPARAPLGTLSTIAPSYIFSSRGPRAGESYRTALAREVTSDLQFSRAIVNYIWEQFFTRALVTPSDGFDPSRLDPDNPPPEGWPLQATHPRLLNELAQAFVDNGYNIKWLMKQLASSEAYQMSSRYPGTWDPQWEPLFARKLVRRLWGEEIHDSLTMASGVLGSYDLGRSYPGLSTVNYAMKNPEPVSTPDRNGAVSRFLDAFLRGDRDEEERRAEGSISQALGLMNDPLVMSRIRGTGTGANANLLLVRNLSKSDAELTDTLFLTVLSRVPTDAERTAALAQLRTGNRTQAAEDLLWSLFNKVDFIFNY
ncbi:MAG: DUF1549 domain-containing protein [Acidobacteria bacterium]|nr:DUF1549 domain-containing protein [Acidobacteriota bacterium]